MLNHRDDVESASNLIAWEGRRHQTSEWQRADQRRRQDRLDWRRGPVADVERDGGIFLEQVRLVLPTPTISTIYRRDRTTGRRTGLNDRVGERTGEGRIHYKVVANYSGGPEAAATTSKPASTTSTCRATARTSAAGRRRTTGWITTTTSLRGESDLCLELSGRTQHRHPLRGGLRRRRLDLQPAADAEPRRPLRLRQRVRRGELPRGRDRSGATVYPARCFGGTKLPIFKTFSPRLRAVFDLLGDAKPSSRADGDATTRPGATDDIFHGGAELPADDQLPVARPQRQQRLGHRRIESRR